MLRFTQKLLSISIIFWWLSPTQSTIDLLATFLTIAYDFSIYNLSLITPSLFITTPSLNNNDLAKSGPWYEKLDVILYNLPLQSTKIGKYTEEF